MPSITFNHCRLFPLSAAGFRPCGASHFLLLRQKKVSKEKATLGRCPLRGYPALLETPGGCATRGYAPQTVLADCPRRFCVARHLSRGPEKRRGLNGRSGHSRAGGNPCRGLDSRLRGSDGWSGMFLTLGPRVERRATELLAETGRGLSEGRRPEFRSPRQ